MRTRLFLSFLLIVLVTAAGVVAISAWRLREDVGRFLNRGGISGTDQLVEALENYYKENGSWHGAEYLMRGGPGGGPWGSGGEQPVILADANARIVMASFGGGRNGGMGPGGPGGPGMNVDNRSGETLTSEEISASVRLYANGSLVGYLVPVNSFPLPAGIEYDLFNRLNRSALLAAGFAATVSLIFALVLAYFLLRPIRDLTDAARSLASGDLSIRVTPRGGKETALLAATFNHMANSLQQAENRRRAMTADIAHELRNPLAVQRANLEALQDGLYPMDQEAIGPLLQQNQQLEHLVEDLRTLALADAGQMSLEKTPTDLAGLLERRIGDLKAEAASRDLTIHLRSRPDCPKIEVDSARIGQIILNLLNNAMQHTPAGGEILVSLDCRPDGAVVRVRDTGPGIPEADLPHIFERFFRGDAARDRSTGSTGLGLSIAKRLAEAHGGSLEAHNHSEGGAEFIIYLPGRP